MIKWRSTTIPGTVPKLKKWRLVQLVPKTTQNPKHLLLALHWRPTCSFRDPWRTPEKPRRTPLEKRWRAPWSTPNPPQKEISTVFPTEQEPIPMETDGIGESIGENTS